MMGGNYQHRIRPINRKAKWIERHKTWAKAHKVGATLSEFMIGMCTEWLESSQGFSKFVLQLFCRRYPWKWLWKASAGSIPMLLHRLRMSERCRPLHWILSVLLPSNPKPVLVSLWWGPGLVALATWVYQYREYVAESGSVAVFFKGYRSFHMHYVPSLWNHHCTWLPNRKFTVVLLVSIMLNI